MYLYIMGRPHSGSTILDIVLGNSAAIESVGELVSEIDKGAAGSCGCGKSIPACGFWQQIRTQVAGDDEAAWQEVTRSSVRHAHIRNFWPTLRAPRDPARTPPRFSALARATAAFDAAIRAVSGKPHVLDSSKEPTRGLMLLKFYPEARVIHLVRDPRRAVASHYWRFQKNPGYFHFLRRKYKAPHMLVPFMALAAGSWSLGNLICEIITRHAPRRVVRVRYEDLCTRPAVELRRIGVAFGIPLEDVIGKIERQEQLEIGHNIGGNQIRLMKRIAFDPGKGEEHALPLWLELLTIIMCWPLMLAYGYPLRRPRPRGPAAAARSSQPAQPG